MLKIGGKTGVELGSQLKSLGFEPDRIEVIACCRQPGPARQDLADIMEVPVTGGNGRMIVQDRKDSFGDIGDVRVYDENKATNFNANHGSPTTRAEQENILYPKGEGINEFKPRNKT